MSKTQQLMAALAAAMLVGFLLVGTSEKTEEEKANEAMVSGYAQMSRMTTMKCPKAIKKHTGSQVYTEESTDTDKVSYITRTWKGGKGDNFKIAKCTFTLATGGITELDIDGKKVISK